MADDDHQRDFEPADQDITEQVALEEGRAEHVEDQEQEQRIDGIGHDGLTILPEGQVAEFLPAAAGVGGVRTAQHPFGSGEQTEEYGSLFVAQAGLDDETAKSILCRVSSRRPASATRRIRIKFLHTSARARRSSFAVFVSATKRRASGAPPREALITSLGTGFLEFEQDPGESVIIGFE